MAAATQLAVTTLVAVAALAAMAVAGVQKRWLEWRPPRLGGQATRREGEQLSGVLVALAAVSALIVALVLATGLH